MLRPHSSRHLRRFSIAVCTSGLLVALAACGGDKASEDKGGNEANVVGESRSPDAGETSSEGAGAPSDDDVEKYYEALASRDPDRLNEAKDLVVPGSYAEATLTYYLSITDAVIAAGYSTDDIAGDIEEIDGGYRLCNDPTDKDTCGEFTDTVGTDGLISGYKIDGEDRTDKLVVGAGTSIPAGNLGGVTLRAAAETTTPDQLNVVLDVKSADQPISFNAYSATYRTPEGRQVKASGDSLIGSTDLQADSITTMVLSFPNADIGGVVTLEVVSDDYSVTKPVQIPTS